MEDSLMSETLDRTDDIIDDEIATTAVRNAMGWWTVAIAIGVIAGLAAVSIFHI